jgi:hypothetical protein
MLGVLAGGMVPRGRIELPTPAFSGPRSTDELPRHGDNHRFYGKGAGVKRENAWADRATRFGSGRTNAISTVASVEVKGLRSSRFEIDREGPELRFARDADRLEGPRSSRSEAIGDLSYIFCGLLRRLGPLTKGLPSS